MTPDEAIRELGLSITSRFVPWSQSRNKHEKQPSLNWRVTLLRNSREILTTDYSAGAAHCPSYSRDSKHGVEFECEHGVHKYPPDGSGPIERIRFPIKPDLKSVIYSLLTDADALDYATFEDWADNFGYDPDSRKAENIYRECLSLGLKLRAAIGDEGMRKLSEAFQDY